MVSVPTGRTVVVTVAMPVVGLTVPVPRVTPPLVSVTVPVVPIGRVVVIVTVPPYVLGPDVETVMAGDALLTTCVSAPVAVL